MDRATGPMHLKQLLLRCFAEKESDGTWFAMCLELNLYARGDSLTEARKKLHAVIVDYLRDAVTKDREYVGDLIPRRAPLWFYLHYAFIWCCLKIEHVKKEAVHRVKFKEVVPLIPAC